MNTPDPSSNEPGTGVPLPDLQSGVLDFAQVEQLLSDIETCTRLLEILPKYGPQTRVPDTAAVTLPQARELLASRAVRGLQLRYLYQGAEWWDTVLLAGDQFRIVRICHSSASAGQ